MSPLDRAWEPLVEGLAALVEAGPRPVVLGINGPQGGGKSTLAAGLVDTFTGRGRRAVAFSIDDVYLPRADQVALAAAHPGDPCLAERGYPGTHDVDLGARVLDALRAGRPTALPSYDKGAFAGRGDRAPEPTWRRVEGPWDLVIFEGWMLGFRPVADPPPALRTANALLAAYAAWNTRLDAMVVLRAADPEQIVAWRVDSERARRAGGEGALSDTDAHAYIVGFLPAYATWLPGLLAAPPGRARWIGTLGPDRRPRAWG